METAPIYKYICKQCDFTCQYKSAWEKHIITELHTTGKRKTRIDFKGICKCDKCDYKTRNQTTFKQHVLNEHSNILEREQSFKYYCKQCDYGTFSIDLYNKHNNTTKHKKYIQRHI